MKDNLVLVINNMACNYNKNEFHDNSFLSLYNCTKADYFNTELFIIDDSGNRISDKDFENFYKSIKGYPNVHVIRNKENMNLLRSRFVVLDYLDNDKLKNTWIRFLDSGDVASDSFRFQMELMMKMGDTNADWYLFLQGKRDPESDSDNSLNSYYYSCYGDISNKVTIVESMLGNFLTCSVWTKIYRADLFNEVKNEIIKINGEIPYLFHTEDYLINSIYAKYATQIASLDSMFVIYDIKSGESAAREVTKDYYNEVARQLSIVSNILKECYKDFNSIPENIIDYYINKKINKHLKRFHYNGQEEIK